MAPPKPVGSRLAPSASAARPGLSGSRMAMNDRTNVSRTSSTVNLTLEPKEKESDPDVKSRLEYIESFIKGQMLQQQVKGPFTLAVVDTVARGKWLCCGKWEFFYVLMHSIEDLSVGCI